MLITYGVDTILNLCMCSRFLVCSYEVDRIVDEIVLLVCEVDYTCGFCIMPSFRIYMVDKDNKKGKRRLD